MAKFVIRKGQTQEGRTYYWWRFSTENNEIICTSESYWQKASAEHSISLMQQLAASATIVDLT